MRWDYTGLVAATDPFGGHYDILPAVWAAAHTTQFTRPGFKILPVGQGSGYLNKGGSFVSYVGPKGILTIVIEKMDADASGCQRGSRNPQEPQKTSVETVTFKLHPSDQFSLPKKLILFKSNFGHDPYSADSSELFLRGADVPVIEGSVTLQLLPNWAYTLSTITTASKGVTKPPSSESFPFTYFDDFESCTLSSIPKYVAPMAGSFDCVQTESGGRSGRVVRQSSPAMSICDRGDVMPYAVLGDGFRTSYNVSIDFYLPDEDASGPAFGGRGVFVGARAKGPVGSHTAMDGIFIAVNASGYHVGLSIGNISQSAARVILHGDTAAQHDEHATSSWWSTWHRLSLAVKHSTARATLDGEVLFDNLHVPMPYEHFTGTVAGSKVPLGKGGYAAFGTVGYTLAEFDNLQIDSN